MPDWMKNAQTLAEDPIAGFDPDAVTVSDTVAINAPARVVWDVLCDMPRYNEWNPFCIRAVSTLAMGAAVEMTLVNYATAGGPTVPNLEYICAFEPERLISWEMKYSEAWPYPARRDQIIQATGADSCHYHSTDAFLGVNGIHVFRFAGPWIKRAFDDSGLALKLRAEAQFSAGG
ncbi:MAG: hypothetical protein RL367_162 [Pseudomonadota bacterium]